MKTGPSPEKKGKKVTSFAARFKHLYTTTTSSNNPEKAWCLPTLPLCEHTTTSKFGEVRSDNKKHSTIS